MASERSGCHPVVAFGIGPRLAAEGDPHPALRVSGHWRFGVAMGFRFQRHGGSHSPTIGLVRAIGITKRREVGDPSWLNAVCTEKPLLFDRFVKFDVQVESPDIRH